MYLHVCKTPFKCRRHGCTCTCDNHCHIRDVRETYKYHSLTWQLPRSRGRRTPKTGPGRRRIPPLRFLTQRKLLYTDPTVSCPLRPRFRCRDVTGFIEHTADPGHLPPALSETAPTPCDLRRSCRKGGNAVPLCHLGSCLHLGVSMAHEGLTQVTKA